MDTATITVIISTVGVLSAAVLGWSARSRTGKKDTAEDAERDATLRADVSHIRYSIDEMRVEQRAQGLRYDALAERVTRAEESTKSAHRRLDKLEGNS